MTTVKNICVCASRVGTGVRYRSAGRPHGARTVLRGRLIKDTSSPLERAFRAALEARGYAMPKARPEWLRNPKTGANLELDFFDAAQQVAIEYDGAHHYEYPNKFHKARDEFDEQVARDRWKDARCAAMGVQLVRIRATGNSELEAANAICAMRARCRPHDPVLDDPCAATRSERR